MPASIADKKGVNTLDKFVVIESTTVAFRNINEISEIHV